MTDDIMNNLDEQMKQQVHKSMPLLARALDRLVLEHTNQGAPQ